MKPERQLIIRVDSIHNTNFFEDHKSDALGLSSGGNKKEDGTLLSKLHYPHASPYELLNDFTSHIPCLNEVQSKGYRKNPKDYIEECLA
mmetsp:Transcript_37962/g.42775  ORF Transcript_37962/g.42775 Transcript_37962/m.42775 type:complete len:89 (-) Transcript_37962:91-357(-)